MPGSPQSRSLLLGLLLGGSLSLLLRRVILWMLRTLLARTPAPTPTRALLTDSADSTAEPSTSRPLTSRTFAGRNKQHKQDYSCQVLACENEKEYRHAVRRVQTDDVVLEIGCHEGITTFLLAQRSPKVVGIDKSEYSINLARTNFADSLIKFEVMDCMDMAGILKLGLRFNVVFLDISGSRELRTLIPVIEKCLSALRPRLLVVKAYKFCRLLRQSHLAELQKHDLSI